ncbi:MAG: Omp28-related outer membrane protein [Bacteroidales bacterium]|nr:Omp28-related outer membrane protein [Bacteroidales bacterium]
MKKILTLIVAASLIVPVFAQTQVAQKQKNPNAELPIARKANAPAIKGDATIDITIVPDDYGSETTWELVNTLTSTVVGSGGAYTDGDNTPINESVSVNSTDCYMFAIYDAYGDGICCSYGDGSYTVDYNGTEIATGGDFNSEEFVYGIGGGCPSEEISLEEITMAEYGTPGTDIPVSGIVKNMGTSNLTSYDVTYNVDGGTDVATYNVTGVNVAIGATHEFTHDVPVNLGADGNYVINVTVSNPNGVADGTDNNTMSHDLMLSSSAVTRTVLLENFTTAVCPNCPAAHDNISNWLSGETNVIWLAHHAGYYTDDYTVPENTELLTYFNAGGSTYAPAIMLDRKFLSPDGDPGPVFFPSATYTPGLISDRLNTPAFISLDITGIFNSTSGELNVDISGTFHGDFSGDLRLGLYIMEDGLEGTQEGATGTYIHNHVMRDAISGTFGDDVFTSTLTDDTFSENYTYTVDGSWDENECTLIAWVSKWNSDVNNREILQAAKVELQTLVSVNTAFNTELDIYPNPSTGILKITNVNNADIQIINQLGQVVLNINDAKNLNLVDLSELPNGTYIVKVIQNETVSTAKILLSK